MWRTETAESVMRCEKDSQSLPALKTEVVTTQAMQPISRSWDNQGSGFFLELSEGMQQP